MSINIQLTLLLYKLNASGIKMLTYEKVFVDILNKNDYLSKSHCVYIGLEF